MEAYKRWVRQNSEYVHSLESLADVTLKWLPITQVPINQFGYISPKNAIHGFGVLIMEMVSGKKNRKFSHEDGSNNLLGCAWRLYIEDRGLDIMCPSLRDKCISSQREADCTKVQFQLAAKAVTFCRSKLSRSPNLVSRKRFEYKRSPSQSTRSKQPVSYK
ncbi:hypothetical protein OSB04_027649 [Centaurea solstitialis]|uniref:Serine-threonine/tyrosine-protein kinase catalytic domain-containing protein n=1 Tax=Centaurea solstitialis TaxID=347529 RepID=A0AA38SLN4_9ASTR|nr:hypothetical protein OSB04_027649 [Centaurea solstitialis]